MKNLIKKEVVVSLRAMGGMLFLLLLVQFVLTFYMNKDVYEAITDETILNAVLVSSIMYFPLMLIPMSAVVLISAVIAEEKKERILQVLFANGVSSKQIWRSKILVTSGISYILNCIAVLSSFIYAKIVYGIWVDIDFKEFFDMFLLLPLLAIAVVNIICLLMWSNKTAQSFVGFIPCISYIVCIYLSTLQVELLDKLNSGTLECIILVIMALIIGGCEVIATKLSKEYLINIHN